MFNYVLYEKYGLAYDSNLLPIIYFSTITKVKKDGYIRYKENVLRNVIGKRLSKIMNKKIDVKLNVFKDEDISFDIIYQGKTILSDCFNYIDLRVLRNVFHDRNVPHFSLKESF